LSGGATLSTRRPDLGDLTATSPPDNSKISGPQLTSPITDNKHGNEEKTGVL